MKAKAYLAYTKGTRPTGRIMADLLGTEKGIKSPIGSLDVLIRWGSRRPMPGCAIEVNTPLAMARASDKVEALRLMKGAGVPTIMWNEDFDYLANNYQGIILGRKRSGMKGKDIVVYDPYQMHGDKYPQRPTQRHEWYSLYQPSQRELRIHVVDGKIIRVQGKYLDFPEKAVENPFVCNYAHGYRFRQPKLELHRSRKDTAINAVNALGLTFGAVDMLIYGERQHVLEVNTAPACSPLTARCYAGAIGLYVAQRSGETIHLAPSIVSAEWEADDGEDT